MPGFLLCIASLATAQDVHFSQFTMSPLTTNPALAGAQNDIQAIANYKNQWLSVAAPYTTMAVSYDMRLTSAKSRRGFWAAGINVYDDKSGDAQLSLLQANLSLAYHIRLDEYNTIGAGFQGGYVQHSIGYGGLQWGNQYNGSIYDSALPSGEPNGGGVTHSYIDAGAGVLWVYNNTSGKEKVTDNHDFTMNIGASEFNEDLTLNIYDNRIGSKNRRKVCDSENGIGKYWAFAPLKAGTYYIDYDLPKSKGMNKTTCVVMLIGYR